MNAVKREEPITLSPAAIAHLHTIMANDASKKILQVTVDSGGCYGFQYQFNLVEQLRPDDLSFTYEGTTIALDPISYEFLKGSCVDYVQELIGAAFVIQNPNASSSCGCGSSFSVS
jgi:iron-sulfur cluster insertion protein